MMEKASMACKNFQLVHQLKNRIRIISPALKNDQERTVIFEILLKKRPEIKKLRSVYAIGSVVIEFDSAKLQLTNLLTLVDAVLSNLAQRAEPPKIKKKTLNGPLKQVEMAVGGMSCASCAMLIEMVLNRDERVKQANVNFATETVQVEGQLDKDDLVETLAGLGYEAFAVDTLSQRKNLIIKEQQRIEQAKRRFWFSAALSLPVVASAMAMMRSPVVHWMQFALTSVVVFGSSKPFFDKAIRLARQRAANMDTLVALGVGSAYFYSLPALFWRRGHVFFEAAVAIVTFVLLGRYLEERARGRAGEAIRQLVDLQPARATLLRDGKEIVIDVDALQVGDIVLIRPGEKIPTDGVVIAGLSTVDEALVTGESMPVVKEPGQKVIVGCVNGNGVLQVKVTAVGMDTVLAGIVHMVDQAQAAKLPIQKQVDKVSAVFVPAVMAVSAMTFGGWLVVGAPVATAVGNAITVLLIACPCALGLATPAAIMVGTGQAAKKGIYIRNGESLEVASHLNAIVFDKTGTITEGKPAVTEVVKVSRLSEEKIIMLAAAAENNSEHFLARAITDYAKGKKIQWPEAGYFYSETGRGVRAEVNGKKVLIGNRAWLEDNQVVLKRLSEQAERLSEQSKTPVFMAVDQKEAALFAIADKPRKGAAEAIARLHKRHIETLMVTGDHEKTAQFVAKSVAIDQVVANARPEDKQAIIQQLQQQGKSVGMIGDGINDAPALAAADVGFAIGSGTDIAIESSDMTLVQGDINKVTEAIELSAATISIIKQNLFWAFGYNTIAIPVAAMGRLSPMIASAAMALSSVSVIANSLRLNNK